ncbi:hypothetical protein [Anaerostipes sp.]|uniref:hypothetical protein n=1 Tax=Anaerostipes sp. TaxID=1872530 RepID=UPI0039677DD0
MVKVQNDNNYIEFTRTELAESEKNYPVNLTKSQIENIIEYIEYYFIDTIRTDESVDNIDYIVDMMEALKQFRYTKATVDSSISNNDTTTSTYKNTDGVEIVGGFFNEVKIMRIFKNPNKELVKEIEQKKKENGGYCPCVLEKTPDTICICKEFREMDEGMCHCGLYIKEK